MVLCSRPVAEIIRKRFSCRSYAPEPIEPQQRDRLQDFLSTSIAGPLGARMRFELAAATEQDWTALKRLGTYGFIRGASGYIIGAVGQADKNMEDYGYVLEQAVLMATDMGLGTCWLGGTFSKSGFARKISLRGDELIPAVSAVGHIANKRRWLDSFIRGRAGSDNRLPQTEMFFDGTFLAPLSSDAAGAYATALEMVRLAPSASNKQPWRIVKDGRKWHFFVQRTKGYGNRNAALFRLADLQRVDVGIAMCHFDLTAQEMGLTGRWVVSEPSIEKPDQSTEYVVTWEQRE
jgi:nitroreductase